MAPAGFGSSSNVVAEARRHLGGNPTGRGSLWCARFTNMVLQHSGYRGTGSDMASSFAKYGQRVSGPQVGAIAVMTRGRRGGHVGIITGIDANPQAREAIAAGGPFVASVAQDFEGIGKATAEAVGRALAGEEFDEPVTYVPTTLVTQANAAQ